jgi:adenosylcobinamide kinase/adenosylcobinamide-phosphate guanylyltransferase
MADIILITGGSRSGKSRHALELGEILGRERMFLATCPHLDEEMEQRIRRHVAERQPGGWQTHEEELDLKGGLTRLGGEVVVVDCLTLWVNNLIFHAGAVDVTESEVASRCEEITATCHERSGHVIFVSNEVGLGVVPDTPLARRYRDLVGRCNQTISHAASHLTLMVSGVPMKIK